MKKIIFIRRNNFDTMLDKATWVKTVKNINKTKDFTAEAMAIFFTKRSQQSFSEDVVLISTIRFRGLWYFHFLFKLFFLLTKEIEKDKEIVIFFDIFTFPLLPIVKLIQRSNTRVYYYIDYRTFYFNFEENKKLTWRDRIYKLLTILSFKYAKKNNISLSIIVDEMKVFISKYISINDINFLVWSSGVEPKDFDISQKELIQFKNSLKDKIKFEKSCPIFIYHGHITKNRGLDLVIDAFNELRDFNYYFIIIGDGPYKKKITQKIDDYSLNDKCIYVGKVPYNEIKYFIAVSDIALVIYPIIKYWEYNNPIKFSEYMILNKHIVTSGINSFERIIRNVNGQIIKSVNQENVKKTLISCCLNINEIRKNNKTNISKDYVLKNYTWEQQSLKIIKHISKL